MGEAIGLGIFFGIFGAIIRFMTFDITLFLIIIFIITFCVISILIKINVMTFTKTYLISLCSILIFATCFGFYITHGFDAHFLLSSKADSLIQTFSKQEYLAYLYLEMIASFYSFSILFVLVALLCVCIIAYIQHFNKNLSTCKTRSQFIGVLCGTLPLIILCLLFWIDKCTL